MFAGWLSILTKQVPKCYLIKRNMFSEFRYLQIHSHYAQNCLIKLQITMIKYVMTAKFNNKNIHYLYSISD